MEEAGSERLPSPGPDFDATWAVADAIDGWLTSQQGALLWSLASEVPVGGTIVEIGSHKGRSTVVLGRAAQATGARVVAIDPFVDGRMFGGQATRAIFERNIRDAGLDGTVQLLPMPSRRARESWHGGIDFLYIDGKHDYWSVVDDLRWLSFLTPQARIAIHDSFCSVGVTSALIDRALLRGRLRYEGRRTTLAVFRAGRANSADRQEILRQMPWFARNVTIKAARRVGAQPLVRALGHHEPYDPY